MPHTIDDLRAELFDTLKQLRDKDHPMDVARARAVVDVASVIVDTAKVEVKMIEASGGVGTGFIPDREASKLPALPHRPALRAALARP